MDAAAKAAAVSAAASVPGCFSSNLNEGYLYCIYSGATHQEWSTWPSPTWTYNSFFPEWHLIK